MAFYTSLIVLQDIFNFFLRILLTFSKTSFRMSHGMGVEISLLRCIERFSYTPHYIEVGVPSSCKVLGSVKGSESRPVINRRTYNTSFENLLPKRQGRLHQFCGRALKEKIRTVAGFQKRRFFDFNKRLTQRFVFLIVLLFSNASQDFTTYLLEKFKHFQPELCIESPRL